MYILHAKNIAMGVAYADTGYIYNPSHSSLGPPTYPPVFPLLLSVVYIFFPGNLTAMQIEMIAIFLMALYVLFLNFQQELPWRYVLAILVCIGLNPYFWSYRDQILSDIPFLFFTYLCLFYIHRTYSSSHRRVTGWPGIAVGLLLYLSYGTRSIGVVLAASLLVYDIMRHKKPTAFAASAILVFAFLATLQMIFLPGSGTYTDRLSSIYVPDLFSNIYTYARYGSYFWDNGYSKIALHVVSATIFSLAAVGFLSRMRSQPTIYEIFAILYSGALLLYPAQHNRYLFPLIPLCLLYAFLAIQRHTSQQSFVSEKPAYIILLVMIFASYGGKYTTIQSAYSTQGIHKKETIELFRYVEENTAKDSVIIFRKPRTLVLVTGRKSSVYHKEEPRSDKELWNYFHQIHASYIVEGYFDEPYFRRFVARYQDRLEKVYWNADFTVYRIRSFPDSLDNDV